MSEPTQEEIERTYQDILKGLELSVTQLQERLNYQIDSLSTKELRRSLKAIIDYPEIATHIRAASRREQEMISGLYSLHQMRVQLEIQILGELQKEKENENE